MNNQKIYNNLIAFHPGSYIEDIIEDLNITQEEFAKRLGELPKTISKLVNGEIRLSAEVAYKLEKLTGVDYQTWTNIQNAYDKKILEIEEEETKDESLIADIIDISYFKKCGLLENKRYNKPDKISSLRKIFNVSNLTYFNNFNPLVSYRNIKEFEQKSIITSNIMLEIATMYARNKTNNKLDKVKLKENLPRIKKMTLLGIEEFFSELQEMLLDCGIVLVALPHFKNSNLHGATKKFKNGSVLLLVTDRNKFADIFWFSLMHEIAHILKGDFYTNIEDYEKVEREADVFSRNFFINEKMYEDFLESNNFSKSSIVEFAKKADISPCIVTGRLKKDGVINYSDHQDLMQKYKINLIASS